MGIVWKPIELEHAAAWAELTDVLARADDTDESYSAEDLAEELGEPGVDPALDTLGGWDGGTMVAYGQLRVTEGLSQREAHAALGGGVHPAWRGRGLGAAVMDWLEPRADVLAATRYPAAPLVWSVHCGKPGSSAERLAAARGYTPARYFLEMRADLASWESGTERSARGGVPISPDLHEAVRRAHNEAFADHWGSSERDPAHWADLLAARSFRPALSRAAVSRELAPERDDAVEAYVLANEYVDGELYISLVGTRRLARGRGLASMLLSEVLEAAVAAGYRQAYLRVDAESPTRAVGLYERVGFRPVRTTVVCERRR